MKTPLLVVPLAVAACIPAWGQAGMPARDRTGQGPHSAATLRAATGEQKPHLTDGELAEARAIGARLLSCLDSGSVTLVRPERESVQLRQLASTGMLAGDDAVCTILALPLLRTLDRLSRGANPQKPLSILSLYRRLSAGRPREPHGNGLAVDIGAYAGHVICSNDPTECVAGVLEVIGSLAPGQYRLGLPKPPNTDPVAFLPPPDRPGYWAFFPAPLPEIVDALGIVAPRIENDQLIMSGGGVVRPRVIRWENERYAPVGDIGDPIVREAIREAIQRGANIHSLFPDALDHLHLDVKPEP